MSLTNFSYGVYNGGVDPAGPNPRGAVLFVNSVIGNDNRGRVFFPGAGASQSQGSLQGPQTDPSKPLASLAFALTFTQAGRGDTIILQQGHLETLAASVTCANAGVTIVGQGLKGARPAFTMAGFSLVLSGAGCLIQNCAFSMGVTANIVGGIQLTGIGSQVDNCHIIGANVTSVGVLAGANRTQVSNCLIDGTVTGFASGVLTGIFDEIVIVNNEIVGIFATAPITLVASTDLLIEMNQLIQLSGAVKPCIAGIVTATSGLITDNRLVSVASDSAANFFAGTNVATNTLVTYLQNFGFTQKAGPSSGILVPSAGTIP